MRQLRNMSAPSRMLTAIMPRTIADDPVAAARQRRFVLSHMAIGLAALAAFPAYVAMRGGLTLAEVGIFALLVMPALLGTYLARSARLETAQIASSALFSILFAALAALTGGLQSLALAGLLLVPAETIGAGSRRMTVLASGFAALAAAGVAALDMAGLLPASSGMLTQPFAQLILLLAAIGYVAWLGFWLTGLLTDRSAVVRSARASYEFLTESMNDMVTRHAANGAVVYASPAAETLIGLPPDALSGQGLFERIHVTDRLSYLTALSSAFIDGSDACVELRARHGSATPTRMVWLEMRCRPFEDGGRQVICIFRDISERKTNEQAIEAARAEAERANLAKGRFLATMSHELRTPLNAIIGFSELLVGETDMVIDADRRLEYARLIHDSGNHLLAVVNGILDMTKIESGAFPMEAESFDVGALAESCQAMLALKSETARITIRTSIERNLPQITADRRACRQIYLNLLSNALKFTPENGTVTIGARRHGTGVALFVSDTGVGVSQDDLNRLGEPFFQAHSTYDRPFDGTGLGLSVVKGLAAMHGGRMEIESRLGLGTTVAIILPLDCRKEAADRREDPQSNVTPIGEPAPARLPTEAQPALDQPELPEKKFA